MNQKNSELKEREITVWVSINIMTKKIKNTKTGVESEVQYKKRAQGTRVLGRNKLKRDRVEKSRLKNPKKLNVK